MCWRHAHCPCQCCGHVEQVSPSPSRLLLLHSFQHWCSISTVGAVYLRARWLTDRRDTTVVPAQTKCWMTFLCSSNCSTLRKLQSKTCCASHFSRHFSYARYTRTAPSIHLGANIYNLYNTERYAHAPTHVHSFDCTLRKLVDLHNLHNLENLSWPFGNVCPHHPPPCSFPCE